MARLQFLERGKYIQFSFQTCQKGFFAAVCFLSSFFLFVAIFLSDSFQFILLLRTASLPPPASLQINNLKKKKKFLAHSENLMAATNIRESHRLSQRFHLTLHLIRLLYLRSQVTFILWAHFNGQNLFFMKKAGNKLSFVQRFTKCNHC